MGNRLTYKRLGHYIQQVDVRNKDLAVDRLLGLSIAKQFIPSIANTTGTDMSTYKIVQPRQFGYVPVTSRNGDKITIALYDGESPCIISQAYVVFEVIDETELLPEYLMMWFRRPEFDRYARFKSHGSAREVFEWEEMCEVMLPVPPIEEQRKIVAEYQAIEQRIENNRRLIATLEATAQTIYRKMFVDNIDLEKLPEGWRMGCVGDLFQLQRGYDLPSQDRKDGLYPVYASTGITGFHNEYKVKGPCVVTGRSGSIGIVNYVHDDFWPLNTTLFIKDCHSSSMEFSFFKLKELGLGELVAGYAAVPTLNRNDVHSIVSTIPPINKINSFSIKVIPIFQAIRKFDIEMTILDNILSILLSKLSNY